ncbi:insulinase family protein [candidate division KSB1 bacterium]|nr:insulinase family protein [candidate division KSB1 bacterium]
MNYRSFIITATLALAVLFCLAGDSFSQKHYKELTYGKLSEVNIPQPKEATLKNGIRVLLLEDHELPFIKMRCVFTAGSAWEAPEKTGLADICGIVMRTGGSQTMPGDQIDEELEKIAAGVETYIGVLEGGASLSTLKEHFDKVLAIYADVLMHPAFPPEKIDLAKIEMKSAISRRNDFVSSIAAREFAQIIYGEESPYARAVEYATVDAISRDDLLAFHKRYVRPDGMVLAVWGDFKGSDMLKKIRKTFESWEKSGDHRPEIPGVDYTYQNTVNLVKKTDVTQSNIYLGHIGGKKDNPDLPALTMMNEILGGGVNSRLFNRLRATEGLAYHVEGYYGTNYAFPGKFQMMLETQSGRTVEAIRSMLREMKLMTTEPVSEDELRSARESWLNSYVFDFDDKDEVISRLLTYSFYGYPLDFLQATRRQLEKVTREDILRVAEQYLHPDRVQILVVGNPADFDEPLSVLGEVNEIDITIPTAKEEVPVATAESIGRARALLDKMAASLGGAERITAVKSLTAALKLVQITPMGEMAMDARQIVVYPDKSCSILKTPMGEVKLILTGESGKMVSAQGSMPAPEPLKKNMKENLFRDPVILVRNLNEIEAQLLGETIFAEKEAFELIVSKGELSYHLFLDKTTHLPLGVTYTTIGQQGPTEAEERYEDYRNVAGMMMPFKTIGFDKGQKASESTIVEVKIDDTVDMSVFEE